jgi:molybdopterin/thiamine biosynthesis adenylyltransferase
MTRHLNQTGLLPQAVMDRYAIGIIGTGAIGSFVAMALAKMGFNVIVTWDDDKIEEHNIANQMFPVDAVGKRKAIATRDMVKQFSGEEALCLATKATGKKAYTYLEQAWPSRDVIIILAVDSLDVRKKIVEELRYRNFTIIDARMGAKTYKVMAFCPADETEYQQYMAGLVPDANAVQERCGQKSIIYTVLGVAAEVCSFINYICMWGRVNGPLTTEPRYPGNVVFDYGTGMRIQRLNQAGPILRLDENIPPEIADAVQVEAGQEI